MSEKFGDPNKRIVFLRDDPESMKCKEFLDRLGVAYNLWPVAKNTKTPRVIIQANGNFFEGLEEIKTYMWALHPTVSEIRKDPEGGKEVLAKFKRIWRELKKN